MTTPPRTAAWYVLLGALMAMASVTTVAIIAVVAR